MSKTPRVPTYEDDDLVDPYRNPMPKEDCNIGYPKEAKYLTLKTKNELKYKKVIDGNG